MHSLVKRLLMDMNLYPPFLISYSHNSISNINPKEIQVSTNKKESTSYVKETNDT